MILAYVIISRGSAGIDAEGLGKRGDTFTSTEASPCLTSKVSNIMAMISYSRLLSRASGVRSTFNVQLSVNYITRRRGFADLASTEDGKLPLKGYKVLDLTRVLAGVFHTFLKPFPC